MGVANAVAGRNIPEEKGEYFGRAFEHFIFTELNAHRSYSELAYDIRFWRTKTGLEVDFVLGDGEVAIEVKGAQRVDSRDLNPLVAYMEEYSPKRAYVVCNEKTRRIQKGITIIPWKEFLRELWGQSIIS